MKTDADIQYLAGIIDGEGTIGIYKQEGRLHWIRLSVTNTSESLINYLKEFYGGIKNGPYNRKEENRNDDFVWKCNGREAVRIIKQIEPYLIIKQEQAQLAIKAWNDTFKVNYHSREIPKFAFDKREQYYQKMKKLNKRGKSIDDQVEGISITENDIIREGEKSIKISNESNLLYFAAIVDGEGTIRISKAGERWYTLTLSVKNTFKPLMEYLKINYGGNINGPYKGKKENHKDSFVWKCSNKKAIALIKKIKTHLVIKREHAELALIAWGDTLGNEYNSRGPGQIPKYAVDKREHYYQQMKKLNQVGKSDDEEEIEITLKINKNTLKQWLEESDQL